MLTRGVVSASALLAAMISLYFVVMSAIWGANGRLAEADSVFMMGGWLLAAGLFGARAADPDYLDPLSINKP